MSTDLAVKKAIESELPQAQQALAILRALPVDTTEGQQKVHGFIVQAKVRVKELEEQRKAVTGPLNKAVKDINSWFKPLTQAYEAFELAGKNMLKEQLLAAEAAQDEALAEIQASGGQASRETLVLAHDTPEAPTGVTTRVKYRIVVNPDLLPEEYFMRVVDMDRIQMLANREGTKLSIPGVTVTRDMILGVRS